MRASSHSTKAACERSCRSASQDRRWPLRTEGPARCRLCPGRGEQGGAHLPAHLDEPRTWRCTLLFPGLAVPRGGLLLGWVSSAESDVGVQARGLRRRCCGVWEWVMVRGSSGSDPELPASSTRGRGLLGVGGACTGLAPSPFPPAATGPVRQRIWIPQVVLREAACAGGSDSRPPACCFFSLWGCRCCGNLLSCSGGDSHSGVR